MSRTTELREAATSQADDLLDALEDLEDHVNQHPGANGEDKHTVLAHARDRAQRCKHSLQEDWPG